MATRWNSVLMHVKSVLKKERNAMNECLAEAGKAIEFTVKDYLQLEELVRLLQPFLEATMKTQGEKVC